MLYTTYLSKMKSVPPGAERILIMRFPPRSLNLGDGRIRHIPALAPSAELLLETKRRGDDWDYYAPRFREEISSRADLREALEQMLSMLRSGKDICLVCCEKDRNRCHRSLLSEWFADRGIEWREV